MIITRTWAIAGAAAALILVPAGVSYAVTTAADDTPPTAVERVQEREQLRVDQQANFGMRGDGAIGAAYGDQTRDHMRDQARDQLRDTENCDGDGPIGDGHRAGDDAGHGGMMGGHGPGR